MIVRMIDWVPIQQRLIEAGYSNVPCGKFKDSFRENGFLHYIIEFDTPEDEVWFRLKWL